MTRDSRPSRRMRRGALALLFVVAVAVSGVWLSACRATGAAPKGARLTRIQGSPQWKGKGFGNRLPRVDGPRSQMLWAWMFGGSKHATPKDPLPVIARSRQDFATPPASGLRVTWLGHSSLLIEIDGQRVLVDPVWGERASPFTWAGPARWYAPPLPLQELPDIDAVIISHDHYDHLDVPTVDALARRNIKWAVPLGVGAHLESWGVPPENIAELDWWESTRVGELTLTATPARHFSGRWLDDANRTLWAGWTLRGKDHNVYYSGDTAMFNELLDIGARLGPFDLTLIEAGAYNALWADVHMGPEQAVRAHRLVRGRVFMPVHWGLFDLALHGWTEPIERTVLAAQAEGVPILTPRPGEMLEPTVAGSTPRWWPEVPWETVQQSPAYSTRVEHLLGKKLPPLPEPKATRP
ncbi:MBL fold metallo-hydrolase [Myxococcaceae bacterium GXIMD 01537]